MKKRFKLDFVTCCSAEVVIDAPPGANTEEIMEAVRRTGWRPDLENPDEPFLEHCAYETVDRHDLESGADVRFAYDDDGVLMLEACQRPPSLDDLNVAANQRA